MSKPPVTAADLPPEGQKMLKQYLLRTEEQRQDLQKQHIENLTAKANDPNLSPIARAEHTRMLKQSIETHQVETLYTAVKQSPNPEISAGRDPLIKIFMCEWADMLHQQKQPQTIGTLSDFFTWLFDKPRFK